MKRISIQLVKEERNYFQDLQFLPGCFTKEVIQASNTFAGIYESCR